MLAKVESAAILGIEGIPVTVEVDVGNGLPSFTTVGLPDGSVRESKDRVKAAIKNSGYPFPNKKIIINLAPADLRKEGTAFDLPIALGILVACGVIPPASLAGCIVLGELSLNGAVRQVPGVLVVALSAVQQEHVNTLIVPRGNGEEAALVKGIEIISAKNLFEIVEILNGLRQAEKVSPEQKTHETVKYPVNFEDIKGQDYAKRAMEIAVSGLHNVLMKGPPGSGKTLIARALPSIMSDWSFEERIETTKIYSILRNKKMDPVLATHRPFRCPHHSISDAGLIGGGSIPRPGEISLAHNGVLFLDELPEFKKQVLEGLRQPLEDGVVTISRAQTSLSFPADFILVAAMNPCPCGFYGDRRNECHCNPGQIQRYRGRISGPLLDRIDMHVEVAAMNFHELHTISAKESSESIKKRVDLARVIQQERFCKLPHIRVNSQMGVKEIEKICVIDNRSRQLLDKSVDKLGLSARGYHRILKLSRTIADLAGRDSIAFEHVAEAIQYRRGEADH
jgi:magnesium chelatase family protein